MMVWTIAVAVAAAEDCTVTARASDLAARLEAAEEALVDIDDAGFARSLDEAALLLPCLGDLAPRALAARYHRMNGLRQFGAGQEAAALSSLRASRVVDPAYSFPAEVLDPSHALRQKFDAMSTAEGATVSLPRPKSGSLVFDGTATSVRPAERATIAQVVDANGAVLDTAWLAPGAPMIPYDAVPRSRNRLLAGSGASLVVSGALYGAAWMVHGAAMDPENDKIESADQLYRMKDQTLALTGASAGFAIVGVGLGAGAILTDR